LKQYIGFVRDHSGSMGSLRNGAAQDYNNNVNAIKAASEQHQLDTIVNTVKCGVGSRGTVERETVNSTVHMLKPLTTAQYDTDGFYTPLFDSVGEVIDLMSEVPDFDSPDVAFLVVVITDGAENSSHKWNGRTLAKRISELQKTDRWTFTFRVPQGYSYQLSSLGIPAGNILEWEQTERGLRISSDITVKAVGNYYTQRSQGVRSSSSFYADLSGVTSRDLKQNLADISKQVIVWPISKFSNTSEIRTFVESKNRGQYLKGAAFYQLTKTEEVQDYKKIVILDKLSSKFYGGAEARQMLSLPNFGYVKLKPADHDQFEIFIQSTSVNRKLVSGTKLVYWTGAVT